MDYTIEEIKYLIKEIGLTLSAKKDGSGKNLISKCPYCGKDDKFGIYIGKETTRKKPFMSHCFSCNNSTTTLEQLLETIGRPDLMLYPTTDIQAPLKDKFFSIKDIDEIDDEINPIMMPDFYRRCFHNEYLQSRGFMYDDFEYFPVGTTRGLNFKYQNYVIFPIIDNHETVGFVARHILTKNEIDNYNRKAKTNREFRIMRFKNSTENDFVKLLYNSDSIKEETDSVILVEGIFDVVALTRKLNLYDNEFISVVATFGKKISQIQIYKLQNKGINTVVLAYDGDAVEAIKKTASDLAVYFDVLVADIPGAEKDWEDLSLHEIYEIFSHGLKTPSEYNLSKIQEL